MCPPAHDRTREFQGAVSLVTRQQQKQASALSGGTGPGGRPSTGGSAAEAAAAEAAEAAEVPPLSPFHTAAVAIASELEGTAKLIVSLGQLVERRGRIHDDGGNEVPRLTAAVEADLSALAQQIGALEAKAAAARSQLGKHHIALCTALRATAGLRAASAARCFYMCLPTGGGGGAPRTPC